MKFIGIVSSLIVLPALAFAHGNRAEVTLAAVETATKKFVKEQASQVASFKGVRGWIEGTNLKVEVFLNNNTKFSYTCHHVDQGGQMTIHCE
ncbi:MAG TPA: hypothetical protein VFV50_14185 [Bdellovibrionales bacterium]|nr:hypothetical protein [Bdellovibrionales bacterium]